MIVTLLYFSGCGLGTELLKSFPRDSDVLSLRTIPLSKYSCWFLPSFTHSFLLWVTDLDKVQAQLYGEMDKQLQYHGINTIKITIPWARGEIQRKVWRPSLHERIKADCSHDTTLFSRIKGSSWLCWAGWWAGVGEGEVCVYCESEIHRILSYSVL